MTEFEKAKQWRQSLNLTQKALGAKLGYSRESIAWFELGVIPSKAGDRKIKPQIWQRYKLACAGLDEQLEVKREWNWETK